MTNPSQTDTPQADSLHLATLEALIQSDRTLAHAPSLAIDEPHELGQVTAAWLEQVLAADVPGARLGELANTEAHSGMTDRQKWRLDWNEPGRRAGLPESIFVKATPHLPAHREMLSVLHMDEAEVKFFHSIYPEVTAIAPACHYGRSYGGGRALIILEDLVERGAHPFWQADSCTLGHARAIALAQAQLHATFWQSERLRGDLNWVRPRPRRFGWPWLYRAHREVRQTFLDTATERELPASAADTLRVWHRHAGAVFNHWDTLPLTVTHGDAHLGNTYANGDGTAGYFDWQVVFASHGLRDLSYFLMSALTTEQRAAHEREIFDLYIDQLADLGVSVDRDDAWNTYCLFVFELWDAAIMTYIHGTYNHAVEAQLRQFRSIADALEQNDVAGRLASLIRRHC